MFKILLTFLAMMVGSGAHASSTRIIDVDSFNSSDHTKTWTLPSATDTIVGRASTDTLTNKTMSGSSNTFTNLPIAANQVQEVPSGTVNSSNVTFTLANTPGASSSVVLDLDGIRLIQGGGQDYTISGSTITMAVAPSTGQKLYATYSKF